MQPTPAHVTYNEDVLRFIPEKLRRVVDVGCSTAVMAAEYLRRNPACEYIGIESSQEYANAAQTVCSRALCADIEKMSEHELRLLGPVDCWVFADVLEHLVDPWDVLRKIRAVAEPGASIVICLPNMNHWSVQLKLISGRLDYEPAGLMDRTHLRWFTADTLMKMIVGSGWTPEAGVSRHLGGGEMQEEYIRWLRMFADCLRLDAEKVVTEAIVYQYVVRATFKET